MSIYDDQVAASFREKRRELRSLSLSLSLLDVRGRRNRPSIFALGNRGTKFPHSAGISARFGSFYRGWQLSHRLPTNGVATACRKSQRSDLEYERGPILSFLLLAAKTICTWRQLLDIKRRVSRFGFNFFLTLSFGYLRERN